MICDSRDSAGVVDVKVQYGSADWLHCPSSLQRIVAPVFQRSIAPAVCIPLRLFLLRQMAFTV